MVWTVNIIQNKLVGSICFHGLVRRQRWINSEKRMTDARYQFDLVRLWHWLLPPCFFVAFSLSFFLCSTVLIHYVWAGKFNGNNLLSPA